MSTKGRLKGLCTHLALKTEVPSKSIQSPGKTSEHSPETFEWLVLPSECEPLAFTKKYVPSRNKDEPRRHVVAACIFAIVSDRLGGIFSELVCTNNIVVVTAPPISVADEMAIRVFRTCRNTFTPKIITFLGNCPQTTTFVSK